MGGQFGVSEFELLNCQSVVSLLDFLLVLLELDLGRGALKLAGELHQQIVECLVGGELELVFARQVIAVSHLVVHQNIDTFSTDQSRMRLQLAHTGSLSVVHHFLQHGVVAQQRLVFF